MRRNIFICLLLLGITLACFWPVGWLGFSGYDDWDYVTHNPMVRTGFSLNGLVCAFTSATAGNWHPLTWLSHMLDCQLFGLNPAEQHWVNLGFHTANTLLLFLLLRQLTGARWRSFLVAGLFAIHPLHVQSVAWIAERKDVLSGFFALLTLMAYAKWAPGSGLWALGGEERGETEDRSQKSEVRSQESGGERQEPEGVPSAKPKASFFYWMAVGLFALGLMAKPMLVTLPLVMLLLDYWPLGRVGARVRDPQQVRGQGDDSSCLSPMVDNTNVPRLAEPRSGEEPGVGARPTAPGAGALPRFHNSSLILHNFFPLVVEKTPFFLLSLASCMVTLWAQRVGQAVVPLQLMGWADRWLHADVSYSLYLGKLFWPANLAVFYPFTRLEAENLVVLMPLPVLVTLLCLRLGRARPYLLVGWLWFVIMLIPVIGLVQVGIQWMADRYSYLPSIGLFMAVVWAMGEIAGAGKTEIGESTFAKKLRRTRAESRNREHGRQTAEAPDFAWRTMFSARARKTAPGAGALPRQCWSSQLRRAVMAVTGAGLLVACGLDTRHQLGFWRNDVTLFQHVVDVTPENNFAGYFFLGNSQLEQGDLDAAAESYARASDLLPGFYKAQSQLGGILMTRKKFAEAEKEYREILQQRPRDGLSHKFLGIALSKQERDAEAQVELETAKGLLPDDPGLVPLLAACAQRVTAEQTLAGLTNRWQTGPAPEIQVQMAEIENSLGNYPAAIDHYQQALALKADAIDGLNNLAWLLATCPDKALRDGPRAVTLAEQACKLTQNQTTVFLGTLAAAQAEAGRFAEAIATAQKACANASARGETNLLKANQDLLGFYQKHQAWHEPERRQPIPPASSFEGAPQ